MSKVNQVLLSCAVLFLILWYVFYMTQVEITAIDKEVRVAEDGQVEIKLQVKGSENELIETQIINPPQHGILDVTGLICRYRPDSDYFGQDQFTYRYRANKKSSNNANVTIKIHPINDKPVSQFGKVSLKEDHGLKIQ